MEGNSLNNESSLRIKPLEFSGDLNKQASEWLNWKQLFLCFMGTKGQLADNVKKHWLIITGGINVIQAYTAAKLADTSTSLHQRPGTVNQSVQGTDALVAEEDENGMEVDNQEMFCDSLTFQQTLALLDKAFLGATDAMSRAHDFDQIVQRKGESLQGFYLRLVQGISHTGTISFRDKEKKVKSALVSRCNNPVIRNFIYIQDLENTSIQNILDMARKLEQATSIGTSLNTETVNATASTTRCSTCGKFNAHEGKPCYALNIQCRQCNSFGHVAAVCVNKPTSSAIPTSNRFNNSKFRFQRTPYRPNNSQRTYQNSRDSDNVKKQIESLTAQVQSIAKLLTKKENVSETETSTISKARTLSTNEKSKVNALSMETISSVTPSNSKLIKASVGGIITTFLIDSGCYRNIVTISNFEEMVKNGLDIKNMTTTPDVVLKAYGQTKPLEIRCRFQATLELNSRSSEPWFYVICGDYNLLGEETSKCHDVLKTLETNPDGEFPHIKGIQLVIPIDPHVQPVSQQARRIPLHYEEKVKEKLQQMLKQGIIEKVNEPSQWVSPLVIVMKKNGQIRICVDMRCANKAIIREKFPLPCMQELWPRLHGQKHFSTLDISEAFTHIKLHESSRHITTFITRWGMYRYTRLIFGICNAPELFQKTLAHILADIEGVMNYLDDIIVFGVDQKTHDVNLNRTLERLKDFGIRLNDEKCNYNQSRVSFIGHMISADGLEIPEEKLNIIKQMNCPTKKEELSAFLGLVTWLCRFIHNLADKAAPLRKYLTSLKANKGESWNWLPEHEEAFGNLKQEIAKRLVLSYFSKERETYVVVDASPVALGAVLYQVKEINRKKEHFVIEFASKSLSPTERRYSQTEREALAIVWGVEKFSYYLLGSTFVIFSDHKPLTHIFSERSKPYAILERWVLRLQPFEFIVKYITGNNNIADPFSRMMPINEQEENFENEMAESLVFAVDDIPLVKHSLDNIIIETKKDTLALQLIDAINNGKFSAITSRWKNVIHEFSVQDEIVAKSDKIYIPASIRENVLELAHDGHPGRDKMLSRLRPRVWWPQLRSDVEDTIKNCKMCTITSLTDPPPPMKMRELPRLPWDHLAADFKDVPSHDNKLLVVIDYRTRYMRIFIQASTTAKETIRNLRILFAELGRPKTFTADNGSPFASYEFKTFCKQQNITLFHSIPHYAPGNGLAESAMKGIGKSIKIALETGKNWKDEILINYLGMYNNSTQSTIGQSPGSLMLNRQIREAIPELPSRDNHLIIDEDELNEVDSRNKKRQKQNADKKRGAKESQLKEGDEVVELIYNKRKGDPNFSSTPRRIIKKQHGDCLIASDDGNYSKRRHISHLKKFSSNKAAGQEENNKEDQQTTSRIDLDSSGKNSELMNVSRPKRNRKAPLFLQDFIRRIAEVN